MAVPGYINNDFKVVNVGTLKRFWTVLKTKTATSSSNGLMSSTDKSKLDGTGGSGAYTVGIKASGVTNDMLAGSMSLASWQGPSRRQSSMPLSSLR